MSINQRLSKTVIALAAFLFLLLQAGPGLAVDTDIYKPNVKQNAYILLDNSGSMAWPVYENSIDYAAMYNYLYAQSDITDTTNRAHFERNKIYLVRGDDDLKVVIVKIEEENRYFTGDPGNTGIGWNSSVDLHTYIDDGGNLSAEEGETARLTVNAAGDEVLLDGASLPLTQGRPPHDYTTLFDGSTIDEGFIGMLKAPGVYFSGLKEVGDSAATHVDAEGGNNYLYFFATGNWLNMQQVCHLYYTSGGEVWPYEAFPVDEGSWSVTSHDVDFPAGSDEYVASLSKNDTLQTIVHPGADQIQVHFSMIDVDENASITQVCNRRRCRDVTEDPDYVVLYDEHNNEIARYNNDNLPTDGWSAIASGDTIRVALISNSDSNVGAGYTIDQYRALSVDDDSETYTLQSRLDVAKEALLYVIDEMWSKINWGFATFQYTAGGFGDGATIESALNPNENDDTNRAAIKQHVENVEPKYGTPLGEALQDVFEEGFYVKRHELDNLLCRKNYVIAVSDGFPSSDDTWNRISGVTFSDWDGDQFTADPSQSTDPNYYDDVATWMYERSWRDKTAVDDPAASYENVITHQIAFGALHPLMQDAAEEAGGQYITVYNKSQMVNAFYSMALLISESISFTAPVVSVDAANKVQNGDDLYMGQFLPMDATYWPGNLKKFKLGDGVGDRTDPWMIYDAADKEAIDSDGLFIDNTAGFWGDENDTNDFDEHKTPDIQEDGVGEVLTERVASDIGDDTTYYERIIKTCLDGSTMTSFDQSLDPTVFGLDASNTDTRNKIVNWVYGYTFDADATTGAPVAARDWALGAIVHSRPTVIDYYGTDFSQIVKRLIVAGADDGMLHVFDDGTAAVNGDGTGAELFAFLPTDVLTKLKNYETELHQPLVDGSIKLYRDPTTHNPKYLIFGLRRGGASFWALDVSNSDPASWTVAWSFSDSEMVQSWSEVAIAKIRTEDKTFTDVAIFSGGYDPYEDNFPEPFNDLDSNGTPYKDNGTLDAQEWDKNDNSNQDIYDDDLYTLQNPEGDGQGRAIYVIDIDDGDLVFSVKYGSVDNPALGEFSDVATQTRSDFKYCFPASPAIVSKSESYSYTESGVIYSGRASNVLAAIYAPDIYGNLFRITYDYEAGKKWQVRKLFSANPDSTSGSGTMGAGLDSDDGGRKVFYGPAVSWRGSERFFELSNYYFDNTVFSGTDAIASVFFGTGDREHPSYQMVQDRVYAVYDDTPVSAIRGSGPVDVESAPYTEDDLLNLTCDELGADTTLSATWIADNTDKTGLDILLTDDVANHADPNKVELEPGGGGENDAKGWYIILENQGLATYCPHCSYEATVDSSEGGRDDHSGEKILSKLALYNRILYFTSYQPSYDDPCNPQGNAFTYALGYVDGRAALNLNSANDTAGDVKKDVTDRYGKHFNVKGLPSGFEIVTRSGEAGAMSSIGGSIIGGGEDGFEIPGADSGIELYYWIEH